jgi:hypothetical protein
MKLAKALVTFELRGKSAMSEGISLDSEVYSS